MTIATRTDSTEESDGGGSQPPPQQPGTSSDKDISQSSSHRQEGTSCGPGCTCKFPVEKLAILDSKISSSRWVVPVLPEQELECLIKAAIELCKTNSDVDSEPCQRFFREGLSISFTKILTDDAVHSWKYNIHNCIYNNCQKLLELIVLKLGQDVFPLLDILTMVFNPCNKFHTFNSNQQSISVPVNSNIADDEIFARPIDYYKNQRGWLVDLINLFGSMGGFQILLERFQNKSTLTIPVIFALIRPFGQVHEYLTLPTILKYFMPILEIVPEILENLTDEELKKEAKNESKNDAISVIIKSCKLLAARVPHQEDTVKQLEIFRLKIILRLLQISSFNGKMNALNEVNKVIAGVAYYPHRHPEEEWLTPDRMAKWIKDNNVLEIVLRDSLHQPQYVEKLEKILRFLIKEKALSLGDLDAVWAAQAGKHDAIVKNVHELLAKLAWDFSPVQLDHLFVCFQASWTSANRKQTEKLLELIRRLAEDDKDGVMADKVLNLFWSLAHSDDVMTDIMEQALASHLKILDYSCSQERDKQKTIWLQTCIEEFKSNPKWVVPALRQIKDICCLYEPGQNLNSHAPPSSRSHSSNNRQSIIDILIKNHSLIMLITNNLCSYMNQVRELVRENPEINPEHYYPDGRYNHITQVQERLSILRFLIKDGQVWLCETQARQIWTALAQEAIFHCDREACFKWFSKLMTDEPDLDPKMMKDFFEKHVLHFEPSQLTESGLKCFEKFFKSVNIGEGKLVLKVKKRSLLLDNADLIGAEYLWRVITNAGEDIAFRAIDLLKEVSTHLGPKLQSSLTQFHKTFIAECLDRLRAHYDTIGVLTKQNVVGPDEQHMIHNRLNTECMKMCRVLKVLHEYITECDNMYSGERKLIPLHRACRGKHLLLSVRFNQPGGRALEDIELPTHTHDTIGSVRRTLLRKIKPVLSANMKLDLYLNGDFLDTSEDRKLLSCLSHQNKLFLTGKLSPASSQLISSPESNSDSSSGSPPPLPPGSSESRPLLPEAESSLPGVLMSQNAVYTQFLFQIGDKAASLGDAELRDSARCILRSIPADTTTVHRIKTAFAKSSSTQVLGGSHITSPVNEVFFSPSPSQVLYNLEVMYAMLMPAVDTLSDKALEFQHSFLSSEHVSIVLDILTKTNFLSNADLPTKRSAYLIILKIAKFLLTILGHIKISLLELSRLEEPDEMKAGELETAISLLKQAFHHSLPTCTNEFIVRNIGVKLSQVCLTSQLCRSPSSQNLCHNVPSTPPPTSEPPSNFNIDCDNTKGVIPSDPPPSTNVFHATVLSSNRLNTLLSNRPGPLDPITPSIAQDIGNSEGPNTDPTSPNMNSGPNVTSGSTGANKNTGPISPNMNTGPNITTGPASPNMNTSNVKPGSTSPNITTGPNIATSSPSDITTHSLVLSISPNLDTVLSLIKIIWAASRGDFEMKAAPVEVFTRRTNEMFALDGEENSSAPGGDNVQGDTKDIDLDDILVCKEALELLTVCFLLNNSLLKALLKEPKERLFAHFLCDTLLLCDEKIIRACVQEQLTLSVTLSYAYASNAEQACLVAFLQLLFPLLTSDALETRVYTKSAEYFQLFCRTLNFVSSSVWIGAGSVLSTGIDVEKYLTQELAVLKRLSVGAKKSGQRDILLQGHLSIVKELVCFLNSEKKMEFGVTNGLIRDLINDYLFPTSKLMLKLEKTGEISFNEIAPAVCQSPESISAGFSLLIGLCTGSVPNLKLLVAMLTDMFYPDCAEPLTEWDYLPPIGPKPPKGFVGLKNAGATCYMNSVLQQLFMVDQIRYGILGAEGSIPDDYEDISSDESDNMTEMELGGESRREYNIEILKQIQIIFGYLEFSQLQYYIPKGLWRHFKLQGEPVNVREQQDAVEFFMNLIESLDEALKSLSQDQIMARILGGLYSDQKICQECPHRYSKEEPFSVISVDIRNQCSLLDSLEQYVKGELLEGADAYMCDKCSKKVVTVKRLCVKKLPPILGIQLKRFEYDFERLCAIKFNDYFEFPRHLDMEPYTVKGLAKIEGEMIEDEMESETSAGDSCTKYKLTGIVVHSGQASGGHYYSYILHRGPNNVCKWYKFDDGDVSECKMDDDEEMKAQCFGGDYVGEIYDHISKRVSVRKQKRWWNAYMLFYTRHDVIDRDLVTNMQSMSLSDQSCVKLPLAIERSVWRQNIKFTHDRNQFSIEYFMFIKQLAMCNIGPHQSHNSDKMTQGSEALSLLTVQLVSKFLFTIGFHTKKSLRGTASDWFECLNYHFRYYRTVRCWFAYHILFKHPHRFCEYLLASPIPEVRSVFMKILVYLAHHSLNDDLPAHLLVPPPPLSLTLAPEPIKSSQSAMLLLYVLSLCNKELSEYGKHCAHYFTLFHMYACLGVREKAQLLKLNVPTLFILIALDEGPGPPIKYQCPELSKLHTVVLLLTRCCDVSFKCMSSCPGTPILRNPYYYREELDMDSGVTYIQPLDVNTSDLLFNRNHYIKKLIEDSQVSEDCLKFLQFLSWENPQMSKTVISDLLQQIAFAYCHELRHFFDLLLGLLIMQDSWQTQRILLAMKGIDDERDGLFDTIQKSKSHYQKRAYQCIKCLVALYSKCPLAYELLLKEDDLKKKWMLAAYWLRKELERRPSAQYTQYSYSNWSPPAIQSNETANGYFLERSNSAKKVLEAAFVLCPTEDVTEREATDVSSDEEADEDSTGGEDMGGEDMEGENWNTHSREHRNVRRRKSFQGFGKSKLYLMDRYGYPSTTLPSPSTSSLKPLPSHPTPLLPYDTGSLPYESVPGESTTNPLPYDNNSQGNTLPYDSNSGNPVPYDNNSQGNPLPYDNNSQGNTVPYDNNSPVNPLPYNDNSPGKTVPYDNNSGNSVPYDNNLQGNPVPYDNTSPGNHIPYHNNSENPLPYDNNSSRGNSSTSIGNPLPYDNNSPGNPPYDNNSSGNPVPYDNNPQENPLPYDTPAKPTIPYTSTANILPYETNTLPYDPQGDGTAMDEGNGDDENRLLPSLPPPPPPSSSSSSPSS